jgi:acetyl esterase/lipase
MLKKISRRTFFETGAVSLLGPLGAMSQAGQTANSGSLKIEKDVVFGKGGGSDLRCDIYRPVGGVTKRMALIHLHGGGYRGGSKDDLAEKVAPVTRLGYVSIAAQYRLGGVAKWPAQLADLKAAIRWTRANASSLGIDPKLIAVVGYSAGGHLAVSAAGTPNRVEFEGDGGNPKLGTEAAACVAFYPLTDPRPQTDGTPNILLLPGSDEAAHRAITSTRFITASFPPTVIYHGLSDVTIPPENSQRLLQMLREAGVPSELHTFAGVPHEFDRHPEFAQATAQLTDFFLERHVLNPRTYPPFGPGGGRGRSSGAGA